MFKEVADIKTSDQLHLPVPVAKFETVVAKPSEIQKEMVQELSKRAADIHSGIVDALRVLAEAWEGDIDSLRSEVLQGVVRFVALYDHEYDPIRLIKQLKRISPLTIYRSGQAMSGPNYQKYMHQILKVYNGSSRSKSLPIKQ